ncbi:MAG: hypothetical protein A2Z20_12685 [Bdellovibrionales bacterium RBG_16_40_8]|nr:MAG: hypothetical protein A2Z20_12685 [Bdellovibrionales bacterium RBG_16_40_8]
MAMSSIYKPGEKVDLIILRKTDLGFVAKINGFHEGLLYHDEIFKNLEPDQALPGYIKKIRPDGGIDLLLQPFGNFGSEELGNQILEVLKQRKGFIPINAKSPAEEIYNLFGVSRKKFKMALGSLYKRRLISFTDAGTILISAKP